MEEKLIEFLIELNDKGLINNHDFDYEKEAKNFANKDENKQLIIYNVVVFSEAYLELVKQANLPPLTNTQHKFAEWLLLEENAKVISQIGDLDTIFSSVRRWLKNGR